LTVAPVLSRGRVRRSEQYLFCHSVPVLYVGAIQPWRMGQLVGAADAQDETPACAADW
jgi:hypothetical protein